MWEILHCSGGICSLTPGSGEGGNNWWSWWTERTDACGKLPTMHRTEATAMNYMPENLNSAADEKLWVCLCSQSKLSFIWPGSPKAALSCEGILCHGAHNAIPQGLLSQRSINWLKALYKSHEIICKFHSHVQFLNRDLTFKTFWKAKHSHLFDYFAGKPEKEPKILNKPMNSLKRNHFWKRRRFYLVISWNKAI